MGLGRHRTRHVARRARPPPRAAGPLRPSGGDRHRAHPHPIRWERVVALHDRLAALAPDPVVELNRAVAIAGAGAFLERRRIDVTQRVAPGVSVAEMALADELRQRARATWAAGDWDQCATLIAPVGALVLDRLEVGAGQDLLDVGTGHGGNVAIPAALRGARVVGLDVTPELLERARRRAADAGVEVEWVEGDAQDLPFEDARFDLVISTFGAMFAPDHARAAAELVRVCRPGGRGAMTTWVNDGFYGEVFNLTRAFLPPPPSGVEPPALWGVESHVTEAFGAAGVVPSIERETVEFDLPSVDAAVQDYGKDFGPFVMAREVLEPQGRWEEFLSAFGELVERFNVADDGSATIRSDYFVITVER